MFKPSHAPQSGFTLVETIVAVMLITVALSAFVEIMARVYNAANISQQQFIAVSLAQEGIDLIRNKRDDQVIGCPATWTHDLLGPGNTATTWQPDARHTADLACGHHFHSATPLKYVCRVPNGANEGQFYRCGSGGATERLRGNFIRTVTISPVPGSSEAIRVDSHVTWDNNPSGITFSTILYKVY